MARGCRTSRLHVIVTVTLTFRALSARERSDFLAALEVQLPLTARDMAGCGPVYLTSK